MNSVYNFSTAKYNDSDNLKTLVFKAKKGESGVFGEIYNHFFKKIYKFIYYRVGHKETAEDLAEEVFLKAFVKISNLSDENTFEAWLYQIARNLVIDFYREKKTILALDEIENTLEYETNLIDNLSLQDQQKEVLKLLKELPQDQQTIIKLKFFEDLSNTEISLILNKTEGAVRVLQHRAITKLIELKKLNTAQL